MISKLLTSEATKDEVSILNKYRQFDLISSKPRSNIDLRVMRSTYQMDSEILLCDLISNKSRSKSIDVKV